ncbi:MAG: NUDIX domain-containing protein [Candidatus Heimdallarchaeota archaeon]
MAKKFPEPTIGALIFNPKGEILLVKSHKWKDKYVAPAGHIELGEKMEEALSREIKEETGLDVYDIMFLCFHEFIFENTYWKKKHFIGFNFTCKTDSSKVKLNSESEEYLWVSPKKALEFDLEPHTRETIEIYIKKLRK